VFVAGFLPESMRPDVGSLHPSGMLSTGDTREAFHPPEVLPVPLGWFWSVADHAGYHVSNSSHEKIVNPMLDAWQEGMVPLLSLMGSMNKLTVSEAGKKGGAARMRALSKKQRRELAKKAARARWNGRGRTK